MQVKQYFRSIAIAISILINAIFGGVVGQTFSARQYQREIKNKINLCKIIDKILGKDHCQDSWLKWVLRKSY